MASLLGPSMSAARCGPNVYGCSRKVTPSARSFATQASRSVTPSAMWSIRWPRVPAAGVLVWFMYQNSETSPKVVFVTDGVRYTDIVSTCDGFVVPAAGALVPGTTVVTLQERDPGNCAGHFVLPRDPLARALALDAVEHGGV